MHSRPADPAGLQARNLRPRSGNRADQTSGEGDQSCLPAVRALLADGERGEEYREARFIGQVAPQEHHPKSGRKNRSRPRGDRAETRRSGRSWRGRIRRRSSGCWPSGPLSVGSSSIGMKRPTPTPIGWNIRQADFQHRKIDKAHARFLSAVRDAWPKSASWRCQPSK